MDKLEGQVRIPSGCAISAVISRDGQRMTGEKIIESMRPMHDRSNGLGGGFAGYGIYPEYKDFFALHMFLEDRTARKNCEAFLRETMEIVHFVTELNDYDKTCLKEAHMSLPRFRGVSGAWHYKEDFTGADIQQMMLLEHRNLGRLSMGANFGTGPNYIGQHIHNELEQWYIMLPGASFTYTAENEKIHVQGGDITYTPHGSHHGSECSDGEKFAYVWFELCENGYPGEIK